LKKVEEDKKKIGEKGRGDRPPRKTRGGRERIRVEKKTSSEPREEGKIKRGKGGGETSLVTER